MAAACHLALSASIYLKQIYHIKHKNSCLQIPGFEADELTEVEVTLVAFDLINSSTVKQLKAVKGVVLHLAQTHPSLQSARPWDTCAGSGRQGGRLVSSLKSSHGYRLSGSGPACLAPCAT